MSTIYDPDRVKPAPDIGDGWTILEVPRKTGNHVDRYWFSPIKHHRFRSKAEVTRYKIALEAAPRNDEDLALAIFKDKPPGGVKKSGSGSGGGGKTATGASASSGATSASASAAAASSRISGPDAGAGHPASAAAAGLKPKPKLQTARKSRGKGVASSSKGYIPKITHTRGHAPDEDYVDEDEITRVYNYPKNVARKAELEEKGYYEPELAGADADDDGGDGEGDPYRHLTNWFLCKPSASSPVNRMALPADYRKVKNLCLYGELLPSPRKVQRALAKGREPPKPQPVVLRRLLLWSIDRDWNDRGIWFQTNDAWYKLEQPCTVKVYNGQSQEDLHLELRAKFGLVSNLLDMLTEKSKALNLDNFFGLHDSRTPWESHSVLTPKADQLERYPMLPTEPFDLELLRREATFVKQHIQDCGVDFAKSNFVKGLTDMEKEWAKAQKDKKKKGEDAAAGDDDKFDYLASAEAAEKRSGRLPWGCLRFPDGDADARPRINRLVEIKVEESRSPPSRSKTSSAKTKHTPPSSADQPPAKKKKVESSKKAAVVAAKARAASPVPASVAKATKKKSAEVAKVPSTSEKIKSSAKRLSAASVPADSAKKVRASPPAAATAVVTTSNRKRALSESDDGGLFSDSSAEDEWKPTGAALDNKTRASGASRRDVEEEPFTVQDTDLHPILIHQVKNRCASKIRAFIDAAGKVIDKRADAFIKACVVPNTVSSFEFMLAVVESLKVSSPSVLELLFDRKNPKKCGARRIFITWLEAAKERMEQRRNDSIQKAILDAVGDNAKTEEELALHILKLSRICFDPAKAAIMTPKVASKSLDFDIVAITKDFKSFAEKIGASRLATICTAHINVLKSANRADASPSDAFGKALVEGEEPSMTAATKTTPKNASTSKAHTSDSGNFKKVGKAAAAMSSVKRSNSGDSNKSNGSKSASSSLGNTLLSELMAAKTSKKKAKTGASSGQGVAYARSMPAVEGKD